MKQIFQTLKNGSAFLLDVPTPQIKPGHLLIHTNVSLISPGTERSVVELGKSSMLSKARQHPEKIKKVLKKIKSDGLPSTISAINNTLEKPIPMGYSNTGTVIAIGEKVTNFKVGNRVLSNGHHAEIVHVPTNLCALVPDNVSDDTACFGVLGAIALQGIRLAKPQLGETIAVFGTGLLGLLTIQLLKAHGCHVLAIDFKAERLKLAEKFGAKTINLSEKINPVDFAMQFTQNNGVDAALITASSKSNDIMHQAASMSRKRGKIILVGVVGLELSRSDFYEKELSFQVSCSYGPGRYDSNYEKLGQDYPYGFVRWTEQRNLQAILDAMSQKTVNTDQFITDRFTIENAQQAYQILTESDKNHLGIIIDYSQAQQNTSALSENYPIILQQDQKEKKQTYSNIKIGFIGAGNYATNTLIPAFKTTDNVYLKSISSASGLSALNAGKKYGFQQATTDTMSILTDPEIDMVVITTQHDNHAELVCDALLQNKAVFVEKPLAINSHQLQKVINTYNKKIGQGKQPFLMIGFNRRFSPYITKTKQLLSQARQPKAFIYTVNAGHIPPEHWVQQLHQGGGRIIGEVCHMVDLLSHLAGSEIISSRITAIDHHTNIPTKTDQITLLLEFKDGSIGTIHYLSNGDKSFPKERLEIFCNGQILQLNNFESLFGYGWTNFRKMKTKKQDKGNDHCAQAAVLALKNGDISPIPFSEIIETTKLTAVITKEIMD